MKDKIKNWVVTYYNNNNKVICRENLLNRTEHEAENEAMGLMPPKCDDWSLTPITQSKPKKLQK